MHCFSLSNSIVCIVMVRFGNLPRQSTNYALFMEFSSPFQSLSHKMIWETVYTITTPFLKSNLKCYYNITTLYSFFLLFYIFILYERLKEPQEGSAIRKLRGFARLLFIAGTFARFSKLNAIINKIIPRKPTLTRRENFYILKKNYKLRFYLA